MTRAERTATYLSPGALRLDRRIGPIVAIYLVIVTVIVGYDARLIADQRGSALIINVAGRQRGLAERYEKDVILTTQAVQADAGDDEEQLLVNAEALLRGGDVIAVQGADTEVHIRPAGTDPAVVNEVTEARRLIGESFAVPLADHGRFTVDRALRCGRARAGRPGRGWQTTLLAGRLCDR